MADDEGGYDALVFVGIAVAGVAWFVTQRGGNGGGGDPCEGVGCPEGEECQDGECVVVDPCAGVGCPTGQECQDGECVVVDPCAGVDCGPGRECIDGDCVSTDPCEGVTCDTGEECVDGQCVVIDPCEGVNCGAGEECQDGQCVVVDPCATVDCGECADCDPQTGDCIPVDDPCCGVDCDAGEVCEDGVCIDPDNEPPTVVIDTYSAIGTTLEVTADAEDPDGFISLYEWGLYRDGTLVDENTGNPSTLESDGNGEYTVEVIVTDSANETASDALTFPWSPDADAGTDRRDYRTNDYR